MSTDTDGLPEDFGADTLPLTRETVARGLVRRMILRSGVPVRLLSEEEIERRLDVALEAAPPGDPWLFAYGSLIWNPMIHYAAREPALLRGWHRRFCLMTVLGRGTPDRPGLMLALDHGGSCRGIAFRIPREKARHELALVFHRELITGAYRAKWIPARVGGERRPVLAFVIDRSHERYVRDLPHGRLVEILATARGPLGSAARYLYETARHLRELGIPDSTLERLCREVAERRRELGLPWPPEDDARERVDLPPAAGAGGSAPAQ